AGNGRINVTTSNTAPLLDFDSPNGSLTIDAGAGDDTVTITSLDPGFDASLTIHGIHGGTGNDTANLNADINFAAERSLYVNLHDDDLTDPGEDVINLGPNVHLEFSDAGGATLKASRNIALPDGSSIVSVDGDIALE